jgi:hypothetical protein
MAAVCALSEGESVIAGAELDIMAFQTGPAILGTANATANFLELECDLPGVSHDVSPKLPYAVYERLSSRSIILDTAVARGQIFFVWPQSEQGKKNRD